MFVCNCNAITESEVHEALEAGVERWHDVHEFHGTEPCCGKCECEIRDMMRAKSAPEMVLVAAE